MLIHRRIQSARVTPTRTDSTSGSPEALRHSAHTQWSTASLAAQFGLFVESTRITSLVTQLDLLQALFSFHLLRPQPPIMISDDGLNSLAIFLGSLAMLLIVLYHFLEVNAIDEDAPSTALSDKTGVKGTGQKERVAMGVRQ